MEFSAVFAQLRREKQLSQRKVAQDLKISQALLSHYENGLREPRFDFVVKACDYYGVSADYMLGRTAVRENPMLSGTSVSGDGGELADLWSSGNMYSLINSVTVLTNAIASTYGEDCAHVAYDYFSAAAYALLRFMKLDADADLKKLIGVPEYKFNLLCERALNSALTALADFMEEGGGSVVPDFSVSFKEKFPSAYGMFIDWLKREDVSIGSVDGTGDK